MGDDMQPADPGKWRTLPARIPLEDLVAGQEVPPKPQAVVDPGNTPIEEATRYPG